MMTRSHPSTVPNLKAICCNICLAFFGSFLWILSIVYSGSNETFAFVFESRKLFNLCCLLMVTLQYVTVGLFLGIYANLSPHRAETIGVLSSIGGIYPQHDWAETWEKSCI